ncbi:MAG: hypothetical protein R3A51_11125 [Nannocystaceae bacterium]
MAPRRAREPTVTLGAAAPRGRRLVITLVDVERDRADGVGLHVTTRGVRPRLQGSLWIAGTWVMQLAARLAAQTADDPPISLTDPWSDYDLRFSSGAAVLTATLERRATPSRAGASVAIAFDSSQRPALLEFIAELAARRGPSTF